MGRLFYMATATWFAALGASATPELLNAAKENNVTAIKIELERGADVNHSDHNQATALHWAAANGHAEAVKYLLKRRANRLAQDHLGRTPLHLAAMYQHANVLSHLLKNKAALDVQDNAKNTALHLAAKPQAEAIMAQLIIEGASLEKLNAQGKTAFELFLRREQTLRLSDTINSNAAFAGSEPQLRRRSLRLSFGRRSIEMPVSSASSSAKPLTLLESAFERGDLESVKNLFRAEDQLLSPSDGTLLHRAAKGNHLAILAWLLSFRQAANYLEARDANDLTPLHQAARHGHLLASAILISFGANPLARAGDKTFYDIADAHLHPQIRQILQPFLQAPLVTLVKNAPEENVLVALADATQQDLEQRDTDGNTALHHLVKSTNTFRRGSHLTLSNKTPRCVFDVLRPHYISLVNLLNAKGESPVHLAARKNRAELIRDLCEHGAHLEQRNNQGLTALALAACLGHEEAAVALLKQGALPNCESFEQRKPIHWAAAYGHKCLLDALRSTTGAQLDAQDNCGLTALHIAVKMKHLGLIHSLVQCVPINMQDKSGFTALHYALVHHQFEVADALIRNRADIMPSKEVPFPENLSDRLLPCIEARAKSLLERLPKIDLSDEASAHTAIEDLTQNEGDVPWMLTFLHPLTRTFAPGVIALFIGFFDQMTTRRK